MPKSKIFILKEQIANNLEILESEIERWKNFGFSDPNDVLYNHVLDLIDDVDTVKTVDDLEVIIQKAEDVEKALDFFLSREGQNTLGLTWPTLSS